MTQRERQILRLIEHNPMISQQELADELGITRSSVAVHISNLTKKGVIVGKGYVLHSGSYAVVVGGVNVDIGGTSFNPLIMADSNPGKVCMSLGGGWWCECGYRRIFLCSAGFLGFQSRHRTHQSWRCGPEHCPQHEPDGRGCADADGFR